MRVTCKFLNWIILFSWREGDELTDVSYFFGSVTFTDVLKTGSYSFDLHIYFFGCFVLEVNANYVLIYH